MKKALIVLPIVAMLAACGTTKDAYERRADAERQRQEKNVARTLDQAPDWMIKPPISNSAVYAGGTASSGDFSMAVHKAKADAYGKVCMSAGGTANQRTRIYKNDSATTSGETSEMVTVAKCQEVDLTGVEVADKKVVQEGNRYRAYVLIVLPTGDANVLRKAKDQRTADQAAAAKAQQAWKEVEKTQ
jgi:hypothetical protein